MCVMFHRYMDHTISKYIPTDVYAYSRRCILFSSFFFYIYVTSMWSKRSIRWVCNIVFKQSSSSVQTRDTPRNTDTQSFNLYPDMMKLRNTTNDIAIDLYAIHIVYQILLKYDIYPLLADVWKKKGKQEQEPEIDTSSSDNSW